MNKQKLIQEIKQQYLIKRVRAQEKSEEFLQNLRKNNEFNALYTEFSKKNIDFLKSDILEQKQNLKKEIDCLNEKIDSFLKNNHIDKSMLEPKYECEICKDTGVADGKMCVCLAEKLNKKITQLTSSIYDFASFEMADLSIMSENDIKAMNLLSSWCEKFPKTTKTNINIFGPAGSGKTFLMECVASKLIERGYAVCFKTAFEINELARLYHIGKAFDFEDCINSDILFIDDLGTEPVLKNVTKEYLYNLVNLRQTKNKPTIITTNLSFENVLSRYDERIFSRLANKSLAINIQLNGTDKRLK